MSILSFSWSWLAGGGLKARLRRPGRLSCRVRTLARCCLLGSAVGAGAAHALTPEQARHLLERTGFGAAPHEVQALLPLSREQAVDRLLDGLDPRMPPGPSFVRQPLPDYDWDRGRSGPVARRFGVSRDREMQQLRSWWLDRMISTPSPFTERMVLFWHNHFVSGYAKTQVTQPLYAQQRLFRDAGTRNFGALLHAVMRDAAMRLYLDNDTNTRRQPNENLARELLELFTMGVDQYSQTDVREMARVLAGHGVARGHAWRSVTVAAYQVPGDKVLFGRRADYTLDGALDWVLAQPQTARFVAGKFYREFVADPVDDDDQAQVDRLAQVLREHRYALRPMLREMLLGEAFWSPSHRAALAKSPVELIVGFVRSVGLRVPDLEALDSYATLLGQELFDPPNVAGWPGGRTWLTLSQLQARRRVIERLWTAYDVARTAEGWPGDARDRDLWVRVSGEQGDDEQPPVRVLADGREVWRGRLRHAVDVRVEGDSTVPLRPKPMWELLRVPRAALPERVRELRVAFERPVHDPGCQPERDDCRYRQEMALYVNWLQLDGRRFPVDTACVQPAGAAACARPETPIGMMYREGDLVLDLPRATRVAGRGDASLLDIERGDSGINSIIEYGTPRLPLTMLPAGRGTQARPDIEAELRSALGPTPVGTWLLATAPLGGEPALGAAAVTPARDATLAQVRALTLDLAFNLK